MDGWIHTKKVELPEGFFNPSYQQMEAVFKAMAEHVDGHQGLRMWGGPVDLMTEEIKAPEPHWVLTQNGIWMHEDFTSGLPRYVHILKVYVDAGQYAVNELGGELRLERGTYYVFDCSMKHGVEVRPDEAEVRDRDLFNLSIAIDSHTLFEPDVAIKKCIDYGLSAPFYDGIEDYISGKKRWCGEGY